MIDLFYPLTQPDSFEIGGDRYRQKQTNCCWSLPDNRLQRRLPVAILVGSTQSREIRYAVESLLDVDRFGKAAGIDIRRLPSLVDIQTAPMDPPDFVLLLESYPGEYTESDVESLKSRFPLAPIVLIFSSWGAGETRTGLPLPVLLRVSWLEAPIWLNAQLTRFAQDRLSLLSVPESASRSQLALYEDLLSTTTESPWSDIVLVSDSEAMRSLFVDWGVASGRHVCAFRPNEFESVRGVLNNGAPSPILCLDFDDPKKSDVDLFRTIRQAFPESQILVYLQQPRFRQVFRFYEAGADLVYPK